MNRIQSILLVTAAAFSINAAYAQTQPAMPDTSGTATPGAAAPETRLVTPTTDPLVQKRNDNAMANQQYKDNAKAAKADYKQRMKAAKTDRKQFKKDASVQERSAMNGDTPAAPLQALPTKQ
jgi:hypothetical protein